MSVCSKESACTFWKRTANIVFTHIRINRGRGAMTFKGGSKEGKRDHAPSPKAPGNGTKLTYSSMTRKQTSFYS